MKEIMAIQMVIASKYPGGFDKFLNDEGAISHIPAPVSITYVVHPNLPEDIRNELVKMYGNSIVIGNIRNFPTATEEDFREISNAINYLINSFNVGMSATAATPAVVVVSIPEIKKEDPRIDAIVDGISKLPELVRGCVTYKNGYRMFDGKMPISTKKTLSPVNIDTINRDKAIGDDDLLNLRIALETATTVEEFLAQV